jgi:hypothetical protein
MMALGSTSAPVPAVVGMADGIGPALGLCCFVIGPGEAPEGAPAAGHQSNGLATIESAAPAKGHDAVATPVMESCHAIHHIGIGRILPHLGEDPRRHTALRRCFQHTGRQRCPGQPPIGDQEGAQHANPLTDFRQFRQPPDAEANLCGKQPIAPQPRRYVPGIVHRWRRPLTRMAHDYGSRPLTVQRPDCSIEQQISRCCLPEFNYPVDRWHLSGCAALAATN